MEEKEIVQRLTETEQRSRSNSHRIDEVEKRQENLDKLVSSVAVMATEQEHIKEDVTEIKTDVKALTAIPTKRWESVIDKVIMVIVGAVVAYATTRIGF